jgi:hypothetical protein
MRRRIREDRGSRFEGLETTHYAKRVSRVMSGDP